MEASNFIINTLKQWKEKFSSIVLRYSYEKSTQYHIIVVEPSDIYNNNPEYIRCENELWEEFEKKFPEEEILISAPKHSLTMDNILFQTDSSEKIVLFSDKIDISDYLIKQVDFDKYLFTKSSYSMQSFYTNKNEDKEQMHMSDLFAIPYYSNYNLAA